MAPWDTHMHNAVGPVWQCMRASAQAMAAVQQGGGQHEDVDLLQCSFNQSINQCYTCSYEAQKAHASHSLISRR